jgi:type VI protein secretion system component VasK
MKYKAVILIVILFLIVDLFGLLFKFGHFQFGIVTGEVLITIGVFLKIIAVFLYFKEVRKFKKQ